MSAERRISFTSQNAYNPTRCIQSICPVPPDVIFSVDCVLQREAYSDMPSYFRDLKRVEATLGGVCDYLREKKLHSVSEGRGVRYDGPMYRSEGDRSEN